MSEPTIQELLAAWRAAVNELESTPPDAERRAAVEQEAERRRQAYQDQIMRTVSRLDQLDAAGQATAALLARSHDRLQDGRALVRHGRGLVPRAGDGPGTAAHDQMDDRIAD